MTRPVIYIMSDGKPGHLAQSRGLAAAIGRRVAVDIREIEASSETDSVEQGAAMRGLVVAAGRATLKPALTLARHKRVPAVAMMNPGWWLRKKFDLCVIPRHDGIVPADRVIVTDGALNGITPATNASLSEGLLLIGGPSKHHDWDAGWVPKQVEAILARDTTMRWTVTDSRRTPATTTTDLHQIAERSGGRLAFTPSTQTPRGWVAEQLQRCGVCWVSEDSVSMVYEALTAGARVGLLPVPRKKGKPGRVVRGIESLVERCWVGTFDRWEQGMPLPADRPALAEADRVASLIIERWLKAATPA